MIELAEGNKSRLVEELKFARGGGEKIRLW